jgi:DNA-binding response OmpR family regulator
MNNTDTNPSPVNAIFPGTKSEPGLSVPVEENAPVNKQNLKNILLVEDDPILARMYREKFKNEGFNVLSATDGEMGLKMALEENINMILLDIMLPRLSGTDLLMKLRQDPKGKDMVVVALTNLAEENEKQKVIDLGVKDYLVKAMQTPEKVVEIVKKYLA